MAAVLECMHFLILPPPPKMYTSKYYLQYFKTLELEEPCFSHYCFSFVL